MVEKVPEFSAESLCLRQGMATSGRWCHMTLLDHVTPCYMYTEILQMMQRHVYTCKSNDFLNAYHLIEAVHSSSSM